MTGQSTLTLADVDPDSIVQLLAAYGIQFVQVLPGQPIDGSFWGDREAGLIGQRLLARDDTPLHSILHEACHYLCMPPSRRRQLHTNAGGDFDEENAVCYLQILLADGIPGFGRQRAMDDMNAWGYSFRLGSARAWFESDAEDAIINLQRWGLIDGDLRPTGKLRTDQR